MSRVVGCLIALLLLAVPEARQLALQVHFLDVGQGDAVLILSGDGPTVLYDGGDSPSKIMSHLDRLGVSRIDLVVASHNHADHIGGLPEVVRRFRPRFYLDNGVPATTLTYRRLIDEVTAAGTQLLEPTAREIRLGTHAEMSVLPPPGIPAWEQNNNAVGAILRIGTFRMSLGGDAEQRQWAWWLQHYRKPLTAVTVHKASHHGSNNGDTTAALDVLSPKSVVIGVGAHNGYGHPRAEALARYAAVGASVYRTDLHGSVLIQINEAGVPSLQIERGSSSTQPMLFLNILQ